MFGSTLVVKMKKTFFFKTQDLGIEPFSRTTNGTGQREVKRGERIGGAAG
jgi:hypothetical protein